MLFNQTTHLHSLTRRAALALGLLLGLRLLLPHGPVRADIFDLTGSCGDVATLRSAITSANASEMESTITLVTWN